MVRDAIASSESSDKKKQRDDAGLQHYGYDIILSNKNKRPLPSHEGSGTSRPSKAPRLRVAKQQDKDEEATIDALSVAEAEEVAQPSSLNVVREAMYARQGLGSRKP